MATQTDIPPSVTDAEKALIFYELDDDLNSVIFCSLLHGIYTGIAAVTLGNVIFTKNSRPIGRAIVVIIILLHIGTTIDRALTWTYIHSLFVNHGQSLWIKYVFYQNPGMGITIGAGTAGAICTVLADSIMIWRCWIVWGRRWSVILPPVLLLVSTITFKIIATSKHYAPPDGYILGYVLCSSFTLASTLWCTLLIIYRIVTVVRAVGEVGGGLSAYRHVIEVLVESSALYSISLILFVAFYARNDATMYYFDALAAIARGVAPTLLVGRVAAGHARPDDSWQGSIKSSLRFGTHPGGPNSQQDIITSGDLEAQRETDDWDEFGHHSLVWSSQEDIANEGVIVSREGPEDRDGHLTDEDVIRGHSLDVITLGLADRPKDDPGAILIVPRD
ncbi:uncharacterized protein EV420DRAFT_804413 [Desarmillaria tabescens]|uniref:Uncharacterized protein n=1 Tax=Armillaria tabescens TaxID=1929756 RepID=A0AA39TPE6_ARMTA|nr:uncharacterized protein EV420DRAFT_804413 [Desarmillaria tabescens]KAK0465972.1 hypothetical protein EV420DRAFT_804413 [Desarmillaria tabescens]